MKAINHNTTGTRNKVADFDAMTIQYPEDRLFHDVADDIRRSIDAAYLKQYGYRIHSVYMFHYYHMN
jgi:hypothetical protein